jgi:hypothetical protein
VLRIRIAVRILTHVIDLIQALVALIVRKRRKGKAVSADAVEAASDALAKAGIHDGLISCTEVHDCKSGHTFHVWEVGRWGHDDSRMEVLGRGADLMTAMHEFVRGQRAQVRPRFTGAR